MYKASADNDRLRNSTEYPHVFPVSVTHPEFPANYAVYDQLSMPMGCIITPFIATEDRSEAVAETPRLIESGVRIARCTACSAYINAFCEASPLRWFCSLCGGRNVFTRSMVRSHCNISFQFSRFNARPDIDKLIYGYCRKPKTSWSTFRCHSGGSSSLQIRYCFIP